jgi:autotransporter-associated beta strand protein
MFATQGILAQTAITGNYTQNFDSIGTALPSGWSVRTGASSSSLGSATSLTTTATPWDNTSGRYSNYSSNQIVSTSDATAQAANTDRALGIRQTGSFGDPGASFTFNFSTINATVSSLSFDLMTLSEQTRGTVWTIEYGIGANPTSFSSLSSTPNTYTTGTFASTAFTFTSSDFGTNLDNQSSIWFRVVALNGSTGNGSRDTTAIDNFNLSATYTAPSEVTWTGTGAGAIWAAGTTGHFAANYTNSLINIAKFGGNGESVTTSGTIQAGGLSFSTADSSIYTVSGSEITLGASGIATTTDAVISAPIGGTAGLLKTGSGNLTLSGTNTFTGNVSIGGGKLIVSADANLGATANDIILNGGTFSPTSTLSLDAGRDFSGSGTIQISTGNTLTINGSTNISALTLSDGGSLVLAGASNSLGALTMTVATSVSATSSALGLGDVTTTYATGTGTISSASGLNLGSTSRIFTVADGSAATDLFLSSPITSTGSARLQKRGAGTLELTGSNTGLIGIQLGAQGATVADGGRILFNSAEALGSSQIQANVGTLEATASIHSTSGLSIGGRGNGFLTLAGSDMTFTASSAAKANSFFKATGTLDGEIRFNVNNTTTLAGLFASTSGTGGASTGITVGGSGKLIINGDASVITEKWTTQDTLTFSLGADGKIGAGGIEVGSTSQLFIDINTLTAFGSSAGGLVMDAGGKLTFNLTGSDVGAWVLFAAGGSGTYTTISIEGNFGATTLANTGGGIWTGSSGSTQFSYNTANATLTVVPEPQIYVLIALGLFVITSAVRRSGSAS